MKKKYLISALSLLGFAGCEYMDEPCMYGVPLVDYDFKGEVVDKDGNPIEGIEVKIENIPEVLKTDKDGKFDLQIEGQIGEFNPVTFTDVDGEKNGGEFASKTINVKDSTPDTFDQDIDLGTVVLEKKGDE